MIVSLHLQSALHCLFAHDTSHFPLIHNCGVSLHTGTQKRNLTSRLEILPSQCSQLGPGRCSGTLQPAGLLLPRAPQRLSGFPISWP